MSDQIIIDPKTPNIGTYKGHTVEMLSFASWCSDKNIDPAENPEKFRKQWEKEAKEKILKYFS